MPIHLKQFCVNKTSKQWTPDVKLISATIKKFWSKMMFEQQNQKNLGKNLFKKDLKLEKRNLKKFLEEKF